MFDFSIFGWRILPLFASFRYWMFLWDYKNVEKQFFLKTENLILQKPVLGCLLPASQKSKQDISINKQSY